VITAPFELRRPTSVEEAIQLLGEGGDDAKLLAGGQSLIPLMKLRLAAPAIIVDLGRVEGLSYVRRDGDRTSIGGLTRHADVAASDAVPQVLAEAAAEVGDQQVRNRGTIGGSLAHADPNADLPAVLVALGGEVVAVGPNGERVIPVSEFFQGFLTTALAHDEVLTEVRLPSKARSAYVKFNRRAQDWALVGCAAVVNGGDVVAWTGVADRPVRAEGDWRDAAKRLEPAADLSGSTDYKRHLAGVLAERALARAKA
jgi:aerobic carbon-monoxide dehydrogenase medium subunit